MTRILEIYGADPARWPGPERAGTLAALNEFPELARGPAGGDGH